MTDFKLTLTALDVDTSPKALCEAIVDRHGENFDAARGDFTATVEGDGVVIVARDVTKGDMRMLREDIYDDFGDENEGMWVSASSGDAAAGRWFSTELDDDDE